MGRPQRPRRVCEEPAYDSFSPDGIFSGESIVLTVVEYLADRITFVMEAQDIVKKTAGKDAKVSGNSQIQMIGKRKEQEK